MTACLHTVNTATIFRSGYTLPLGKNQKTTTMAQGYVNNKHTYCQQIKRPNIIQVCSVSIQFMSSHLTNIMEFSFAMGFSKCFPAFFLKTNFQVISLGIFVLLTQKRVNLIQSCGIEICKLWFHGLIHRLPISAQLRGSYYFVQANTPITTPFPRLLEHEQFKMRVTHKTKKAMHS